MGIREEIGKGHWKDVMNKEDFNEPRPVYSVTNHIPKVKDITTGFGLDEIRKEIDDENQRIEMLEYEYDYQSSEEEYFDEENY